MQRLAITVAGAGITGLWQALTLARRGHRVRLVEASRTPFACAASQWAGAMLAPFCEEEGAPAIIRELGLEALELWRRTYPAIVSGGTLVVAAARDRTELMRFGQMTQGYERLDAAAIDTLEPDLAGRFQSGLYYPAEAHMMPLEALQFLLDAVGGAGVEICFDTPISSATKGIVVDCRGLGARDDLPLLRGVRGERIIVRTREVGLRRPVRLLHPRHPVYVVPWPDGRYMIGATVIESEDTSPMTVRSALELLGLAYALAPAFGEAEVVEFGAGLRPAFPDNVPKVVVRGPRLFVNGVYRHGFLLAPVLSRIVADFLDSGERQPGIVIDG